jgi:hypothetical protein
LAWQSQSSAGAQTRDKLAFERTAALDVEALVDGLVANPHGFIVGEVDPEPMSDLLRTPPLRPVPVSPVRLVQALPDHRRPRDRRAIRTTDLTGQALLHVLAQSFVPDQLRSLRAARDQIGLPLRNRRAIVQLAASRRGVAS